MGMTSENKKSFGTATVPFYNLIAGHYQKGVSKREASDEKHAEISVLPDMKDLSHWKSAMTFRSKRPRDVYVSAAGEEFSGAISPSTLRCENMTNDIELSEPSKWSSIRRRGTAMTDHEGECHDDDAPFSPPCDADTFGFDSQLHVSSIDVEDRSLLSTLEGQRSSMPTEELGTCPPPQAGRPLSAHPLLVKCFIAEESPCSPPSGKPLSPLQLKRKPWWGSEEKRNKNKRRVMCIPQDEHIALDAAVTLSRLAVPAPSMILPPLGPTTSKILSSPGIDISTPPPHDVRMALPPPPFRLWESKR